MHPHRGRREAILLPLVLHRFDSFGVLRGSDRTTREPEQSIA